ELRDLARAGLDSPAPLDLPERALAPERAPEEGEPQHFLAELRPERLPERRQDDRLDAKASERFGEPLAAASLSTVGVEADSEAQTRRVGSLEQLQHAVGAAAPLVARVDEQDRDG